MELLLFLSALLTALTGAISGVRAPEPQFHQSVGPVTEAQPWVATSAVIVPSAQSYLALRSTPSRAATALEAVTLPTLVVPAATPLFLSKPRA